MGRWNYNSSTGRVVGSAGQFQVQAGHLYDQRGDYIITTAVANSSGNVVFVTSSVTVTHTVLVFGQHVQTIDGRSVDGQVATFTSDNVNARPNDFIAMIHWGDGRTSVGSISGKDGLFEVRGRHVYQEHGDYPIEVVVTEDDPAIGDVTVDEGLRPIDSSAIRIFGETLEVDKHGFATGTVLRFEDPEASDIGDYATEIKWGDGVTSNGTLILSGNEFLVQGTHQYRTAAAFGITVVVQKRDAEFTGRSSIIVENSSYTPTQFGLTVDGGNVIAQAIALTEAPTVSFGNFNASTDGDEWTLVAWGDGTQAYAYGEIIPIIGNDGGRQADNSGRVSQRLLIPNSVTGGTFRLTFSGQTSTPIPYDASEADIESALESLPGVGEVAVTSDVYVVKTNRYVETPVMTTKRFKFDFGVVDRNSLPLVRMDYSNLVGAKGAVEISAFHQYLDSGTYSVRMTAFDHSSGKGGYLQVGGTASVSMPVYETNAQPICGDPGECRDITIVPRGTTIDVEENYVFTGTIGSITGDATGYAFSIDWGDGEVTPGAMASQHVTGSHAYIKPGSYKIHVIGTHPDWLPEISFVSGAHVTGALLLLTGRPSINVDVGESSTHILADTGAGNNAVAVVEWGDGNVEEATIQSSIVSASHTYLHAGEYVARISVRDGDALAVVTTPISVVETLVDTSGVKPLPTPLSADEGQHLVDVVVATFEDANPVHIGGLHSAKIAWGDGHISDGRIESIGGDTYVVKGDHVYLDPDQANS